jgi:hypothetical protein
VRRKMLRHAVALALVGWYLMMPPLRPPQSIRWSEGKFQVDTLTPAPLSQWTIVDSFDSARECRESHLKLLNDRLVKLDHDRIMNSVKGYIQIEQAYNAKCVASDDPRLKEK